MIKTNPFRAIQTKILLSELSGHSGPLPEASTIATLLKLGADPWARSGGEFDSGVLSLILLRCPEQAAIDAWFKSAGDLSRSPWISKGSQNPLVEVMDEIKQTETFHQKIAARLCDNGARLVGVDDIEQFVDALLNHHHPIDKGTRDLVDGLGQDCSKLHEAIDMALDARKHGLGEGWKQIMRNQKQLEVGTPNAVAKSRTTRL